MHAPFDIVFLLLPNFSMIALYSALEPLRVANRFAGHPGICISSLANDGETQPDDGLLEL